jgi:hypothetical protein
VGVSVGTAPQHRFALRLASIAALAVASLVSPSTAAALSPDADAGTWGAHGRVLAMVRSGNILYLGGRFDRVQSPDGKTRVAANPGDRRLHPPRARPLHAVTESIQATALAEPIVTFAD